LSMVNSLQYGGGPGRALSFNYSVTNGFGINGSYSSIHNRPGGPSKGYDLLGIQTFGQATSYGLVATNSVFQSSTFLLAVSGSLIKSNFVSIFGATILDTGEVTPIGGLLVLTNANGTIGTVWNGVSNLQVTTTNNSIYVFWNAPTNLPPQVALNISPTLFSNVAQSNLGMVFVNGVLTTNYSFTTNGLLQLPGADFLATGTNGPTSMPRPARMSPDDPASGHSLVDDSLVEVAADMDNMDKLAMRPVTAVPEPETFSLFLLASGAAIVATRHRRR